MKVQWNDLSDDRKVKYILERVLGYECFDSWEGYLQKYGVQEYMLGAGQAYTTATPTAHYAWWRWRVFSESHDAEKETLVDFDPLHSMSDAWIVLQRIAALPDEMHERKTAFFALLGALPLEPLSVSLLELASWTPEKICHAALIAYEVIDTEPVQTTH